MPTVGDLAPAFELPRAGGGSEPLVVPGVANVVYFYRGAWCPFCNTYLSRFASVQDELLALGAVRAVTSDEPDKVGAAAARSTVRFPVLIDRDLKVIDAFGLRHAKGGPGGIDITKSAVLVLDSTGRVSYAHVGTNPFDRPPLEAVLTELGRAAGRGGEAWKPRPFEGIREAGALVGGAIARKIRGG